MKVRDEGIKNEIYNVEKDRQTERKKEIQFSSINNRPNGSGRSGDMTGYQKGRRKTSARRNWERASKKEGRRQPKRWKVLSERDETGWRGQKQRGRGIGCPEK